MKVYRSDSVTITYPKERIIGVEIGKFFFHRADLVFVLGFVAGVLLTMGVIR